LAQAWLSCTEYASDIGENAAFGQTFHDAVHQYLLTCQAQGEETRLEDVDRIAREAFFREARGLAPARLADIRDLLDRFAHSHAANLDTLFKVEYTLTTEVSFAILTGTVDRLDRTDGGDPDDPPTEIQVRDWKTQWAQEDFSFQMRWYGALACLEWPSIRQVTTEVDYVRVDALRQVETYDRDQLLTWWEDVLYGLQQRLEGPKGTPTGGAACQYCRKRMHCAASSSLSRAVPENESQAQELFQDFIRFEHAVEEHRKGLQAYFNDRPPVVWQGFELGFLRPREEHWHADDPRAVKKFLDNQGLEGDLALVTAVDAKKVAPYLQKEMVEAGVAAYRLGEPQFKHRKAAEGKVPVRPRPTVVPDPSVPPSQPEQADATTPAPAVSLISPSTEPESAASAAAAPAPIPSPSALDPGVAPASPGFFLSPAARRVVDRLRKAAGRSTLTGPASAAVYVLLRKARVDPALVAVIFPEAGAGPVSALTAAQGATLAQWSGTKVFRLEREAIKLDLEDRLL
jgi:hypothetical protein